MAKKKHRSPLKYSKAVMDKSVQLYRERGCTNREVAESLGISERQLYNWLSAHDEFRASAIEAKDNFDTGVVEENLHHKCKRRISDEQVFEHQGDDKVLVKTTTKVIEPDTTSMIFWLKNRSPHRWSDKQEMQHSGDVTINVTNYANS